MENKIDPNYVGEGIYREYILEHYKNPKNYGALTDADIEKKEFNPLCGDEVTVYINLDENKNLKEIKCLTNGCAISRSATSILSDEIKGKNIEEIKKLTRDDVIKLLQIQISAARVKCAVLGLIAIKNGIKEFEGENGKA